MKKYFILLSKIIVFTFLFLLAIGISWSLSQKEEEIIVPGYFTIPLLLITFLTILVFIIMFIGEIIAVIKEKETGTFKKLFSEFVLFFSVLFISDVFISKNNMHINLYCGTAIVICIIHFALHIWKRN
jgi:Na+-transporting methylmalonyl-CoA/oxaloacetate decarboxylase gamma subunit